MSLHRRGGAGAGDPNHPALQLDPTATYKPSPPQSTYVDGVVVSEHTGISKVFIVVAIISFMAFVLIVAIAWILYWRYFKKTAIGIATQKSQFASRFHWFYRLKLPHNGWKKMPEMNDPDGEEEQIYGQDAFEMNHDFNTYPFSPSNSIQAPSENPSDYSQIDPHLTSPSLGKDSASSKQQIPSPIPN
ncbi:hypothetical protein O181_032385 [Austropuccinia psidii MF-1]|uniref:Uncharacterized protein n=1 Tax=Austropuccinia psidii MF-1 TaxID=1389203 RepID=A0A9Q3H863_9BASI|nr:hypothetical protein [Austropuccinia psidii MF-1]